MADTRSLERTSQSGIFRRHAADCTRPKRGCNCPYVLRYKDRGTSRKEFFATFDLARERKGELASGNGRKAPRSTARVDKYAAEWLKTYRGRTSRGLEDTTRVQYAQSFRLHVDPFPLGRMRMRDLGAPDVRDWLADLERADVPPATIRKAKAALSVMLATAVEDGDLAYNPAIGVRYVPSDDAKRRHPPRKSRPLTGADVAAILNAMPEEWRAFFTLLAQSGVRIGELLGLTWQHVHLGDDPHVMVAEQVYQGKRKRLKTAASLARVPISPSMASWLTELRPADTDPTAPVFPSKRGTPLNYANVYNRVLRPALRDAGIALKVGTDDAGHDVWDYQGVAFHAFRKACGSLLLANGKTLKQVQGWLRHAQLTTTMNVYITQVDDGLGGADVWDDLMPGATRGPRGATEHPGLAANDPAESDPEPAI